MGWVNKTDNTYWTGSGIVAPTWTGVAWSGFLSYSILNAGAWAVGYRPTKCRITGYMANPGNQGQVVLTDDVALSQYYVPFLDTPTQIEHDLTLTDDLTRIIWANYSSWFWEQLLITAIEFFEESETDFWNSYQGSVENIGETCPS